MPSFKDTLELVLHADASGAISELKHFSSETESQVKKSESSLKRLSTGALKLGAGGMGVGAMLTSLGDEARQATQQLDAAISAAGESAEEYSGKIEEAVKSDEKFGHTAHETENALTTLVNSYGDTGKALDRMQLVEDIAAVRHISLASAADLVAKAHGGSAKVFKQFGIQVGENADGTKDYEGALDQLSRKVSGQASASMAGFTGFLKGVSAAVEDNVAEFGQKFGPAILGVSTGLTALGGIGTGVSSVMSRVRRSTEEAGEGATSLGSKLGKAGVAAGVAVGIAALYEYGLSLEKTGLSEKELTGITQLTFDQQAQFAVEMVKKFKGPFAGMIDDLITQYERMGPAGVTALRTIRDALAAAGQDTSKFDKALEGMEQAQKNANEATDAGTIATNAYGQSLKELDDQLHANLDPLFAVAKAIEANKKALYEAAAAGDADAEKNRAVAESAIAVHDATLKLESAMKAGTLSIDGAKMELGQFVAQGLLTQAQADEVAASLQGIVDKADALDGRHIDVTVDVHAGHVDIPDLGPEANKDFHGITGGGDSPGRVTQQSRFAPQPIVQNYHVHAIEPTQSANEIAAHQRAQQFLR